jgi:hypothetical protein
MIKSSIFSKNITSGIFSGCRKKAAFFVCAKIKKAEIP